jgi:hypothetical protein
MVSFTSATLEAQQANAERQVLATLGEGESFVYGESCFALSAGKTDIYFVTKKGNEFYIYDNGIKKGPLNELTEEMLRKCDHQPNPLCARYDPNECAKEDSYNKFVVADENSALTIKVKDRVMGPYIAVMQFAINCDETKFAALVMSQDQSVHLIHSSGKDIVINGLPQWLLLSPDGDKALAAFGKMFDPSTIDFNNINIAEFTSFKIIDLNGTVFGPYDGDKVTSGNFWFCKTAGSHWFMSKEEQLFRDGVPWRKEVAGYGSCDYWISEEGNHIGLVDYNQGTLKETPDLWLIKNPMQIIHYQERGKTFLRWITLEDEKNVVSYKKVL